MKWSYWNHWADTDETRFGDTIPQQVMDSVRKSRRSDYEVIADTDRLYIRIARKLTFTQIFIREDLIDD